MEVEGGLLMAVGEVAVLGVGMHPWGKWGRNFVEYGIVAAREALADAGLGWTDIQFVSGADTVRNGYPGYVAGATFAQALSWQGAQVTSAYAACASAPTPRPRASWPPRAAIAPTTPTGCGSGCWARPAPPTSPSTPGGAWRCSA